MEDDKFWSNPRNDRISTLQIC